MAQHAPPEETLVAYAAGKLAEPLALLVAAHASLSPDSRREVRLLEEVGGAMLETLPPAEMEAGALDSVLDQLDADDLEGGEAVACGGAKTNEEMHRGQAQARETEARKVDGGGRIEAETGDVPTPLRPYVGTSFDALPWRDRGSSVAEYRFLDGRSGYRTRLMRIRAGAKVPSHTHEGCEYTLVLKGGFSDAQGEYSAGDLAVADAEVTHQPVAWPEQDCICLTVLDAPVRMTGPVGRVLNFFVDF